MIDYTSQIRTFGTLGYSPSRIADILNLAKEDRIELISRIRTPDDNYYKAYQNGKAIGEWNIDAELAKKAEKGDIEAMNTLATRTKEREMKDLKANLFGV